MSLGKMKGSSQETRKNGEPTPAQSSRWAWRPWTRLLSADFLASALISPCLDTAHDPGWPWQGEEPSLDGLLIPRGLGQHFHLARVSSKI